MKVEFQYDTYIQMLKKKTGLSCTTECTVLVGICMSGCTASNCNVVVCMYMISHMHTTRRTLSSA